MPKFLKTSYVTAGILCIIYYFLMGIASRFGQSLSLLWPFAGSAFIAAGILCTKPLPRFIRLGWRICLLAGMAWLMIMLGFVLSGMFRTAPANMDYLIVLGARVEQNGPSPALTRRINAAMEYLEDSPDTIIIASGGQGSDEPMSEALCIRNELIRRGISPDRILLEDQSTDTYDNIAFSKQLIENPAASTGILTNNFHVYRAEKLARSSGLENACGIAARYTGWTLFHYMVREAVCITVELLRGNF